MSLATKYRPNQLEDMIGNEDVINSLVAMRDNRDEIPHTFLFVGESGCVDKDTEFLSPEEGWIKISEYDGGQVLQYNKENATANFVIPLRYIKNKKKQLSFFKTKYGVNQCLSDNHTVLYKNRKTGDLIDIEFKELKKIHNRKKNGFNGAFLTTFSPIINTNISLTDEQIKVQVMVNADATIIKNRKKCGLNLKKPRKIERAELLLKEANIQFDKYYMKNGYVRFYFMPPLKTRGYAPFFYNCNSSQLKVVTSEVMFWDGDQKKVFNSTVKATADFIQYAYTSCGIRATICVDKRNPITYRVITSMNKYVGIASNAKKIEIQNYSTLDGHEYCFQVPSSYLVLRRNDRIFITGNCGKTSFGRIIADELIHCHPDDMTEVDAAQYTGIDSMREVRQKMRYRPMKGKTRVWLMDEIHMLSPAAQESLLKALEEPPEHVYFILCTTEPNKLKITLKRRCSLHEVQSVTDKEIIRLLKKVEKDEGAEKLGKEVCKQIAQDSMGRPGMALQILDSIIAMPEAERLNAAKRSAEMQSETIELCRALMKKQNWNVISRILQGLQKQDPEQIRRAVLGYCNAVLLKTTNQFAYDIMEEFVDNFYDSGKPGLTFACYRVTNNVIDDKDVLF